MEKKKLEKVDCMENKKLEKVMEEVRMAYDKRSHSKHGRKRGRKREEQSPSTSTWAMRHMLNLMKRLLYERYVRRGQAIGDFCCGQGGDLAKAAHQKVKFYVGIDFSHTALEEAKFRAKNTPHVKRSIEELMFHAQDLRKDVVLIEPSLDIISCQLALHYIWDSATHIDTFLTSVRGSLQVGGYFIVTILDAEKIPAQGILNHSYIKLTPPQKQKDSKYASYRFTFPGLVRDVEEYVIPKEDLLAQCATFSLQLVDTFNAREVLSRLKEMHPTKPTLSEDDWVVLDLYRCYAFQKK